MQNGAISDAQITASSMVNAAHGSSRGRLHMRERFLPFQTGAWAALVNDSNPWLQVDLRNQIRKVTRVATQGRNSFTVNQWVTKYKLKYSQDDVDFFYFREQGQREHKVKQLIDSKTIPLFFLENCWAVGGIVWHKRTNTVKILVIS